jgi:hypothetical protein
LCHNERTGITAIPRFLFHIRDHETLHRDQGGEALELQDAEAAKLEALKGARDILREAVFNGKAGSLCMQIEVENEAGEIVAVVPVGHVVGTPTQS